MTIFTRLELYWNTIKYLKLIQILGRFWIKLPSIIPLSKNPLSSRKQTGILNMFVEKAPCLDNRDEFIFLNETAKLNQIGWDSPNHEKLWKYNLHYFDYLNSSDSKSKISWHKDILRSWILSNPTGKGTGWEPYPTSLRIVNWIKWMIFSQHKNYEFENSLIIQSRWLYRNIEYHLLGNHLFANGKALIFAGLYFDGKEANKWAKRGTEIITKQIDEQILSDGGHFERSPMYHAIILEDLLDIINVSKLYPDILHESFIDDIKLKASKMINWMECMIHPDQEISFFNDCAFGISSKLSQLKEYANRLELNIKDIEIKSFDIINLYESGYSRITSGEAVAIVDIALVGPDYIPGHAHADTLSFEFSFSENRIFVNSGTSTYADSQTRINERKTKSHNTVVIDNEDSSEIWKQFRVARRAYPQDTQIDSDDNHLSIKSSHNGYRRLENSPIHKREWIMLSNEFRIIDEIVGDFKTAYANYILHPDIELLKVTNKEWKLILPTGKCLLFLVKNASANIKESYFSPRFGVKEPTKSLIVNFKEQFAETRVSW